LIFDGRLTVMHLPSRAPVRDSSLTRTLCFHRDAGAQSVGELGKTPDVAACRDEDRSC
jgi:hypothetical protein